jgi:GNAT superfamily N-acetyltransferase
MLQNVGIRPISLDDVDLDGLRREALSQGFRFLERLQEEWASGANRFDAPGELLLGEFAGAAPVGIGGLNRDPWDPQPDVGRLRHLYVAEAFRRHGLGAALVHHLLKHAAESFRDVRLRTDSAEAAAFYERTGFVRCSDPTATHRLPGAHLAAIGFGHG